ncbi:MAG: GGDEF domain-containing protein, partial [Oscillospiraceae bacterium]
YNCGKRSNLVIDGLIVACLGNFFIQTVLNFTHVFDYASMSKITAAINVICFISMVTITIIMMEQKRNVEKSFYFSMIFLAIGNIIDLVITHAIGSKFYLSSQVSVVLFAVIQITVTAKTFLNYYKMGVRSNIYHQMAYTDNMTNMGNRLAFDSEISLIEGNRSHFSNIWCVVIDINNLKHVNDSLGHQTGDWLISSVAQIINVAFEDFGKTYRIGGDEFVIMVFDREDEEMKEKIEYIDKLTHEANSVCDDFQISVAIGYDKRNNEDDEHVKDLFSRVDKLMYENKSYIKSQKEYQVKL